MTRKLASIKTITEVRPIPDADSIECAIVGGGWPVVVKKGEYQVGDLAIYLEIDSWVPHDLAPFLSKGQDPREYNGVKGERLKTMKFRGQVSQGLLLPTTILDEKGLWPLAGSPIGFELTQQLGIQKWEPYIPPQLAGVVKGNFPSFVPKTDQERCQNLVEEIFRDRYGERYEVTLKLDGSSCTVYCKDGNLGVCSRNLDLEETENNTFWSTARSQKVIEALLQLYNETGDNLALQFELIGEGIQGNQEKIQGQRLYLFDIFNIDEQRYLSPEERQEQVRALRSLGASLEHVPVLNGDLCVSSELGSLEALLAFADGPSMNPQARREGLVFKSLNSDFSFKAISNVWLCKTGK